MKMSYPADFLRGLHPHLDAFLDLTDAFATQDRAAGLEAGSTVVTDDSPKFFRDAGANLAFQGDLAGALEAHRELRASGYRGDLNVCYDRAGTFFLFRPH